MIKQSVNQAYTFDKIKKIKSFSFVLTEYYCYFICDTSHSLSVEMQVLLMQIDKKETENEKYNYQLNILNNSFFY